MGECKRRGLVAFVVALVGLMGFGEVAEAQYVNPMGAPQGGYASPAHRVRFAAYGSLRVGGEVGLTSGGSTTSPLDTGYGFGIRGEFPLGPYFAAGALIQWNVVRAAGVADDRLFDISGLVKGRYVFERVAWGLEVYLGVPVGFTVLAPNGGDPAEIGWNMGVLGGAQLFLSARFGVLLEAGFTRQVVLFSSGTDVYILQGTINIGAVLSF